MIAATSSLSCHKCNKLRSNLVQATDPLTHQSVHFFNPRRDEWHEHFAWERGGLYIVGRTAMGRAAVAALCLNDSYHQSARTAWMLAGVYPPTDER